MNKYFKVDTSELKVRLSSRIEALILRNLAGRLKNNDEWGELRKGVAKAYSKNGEFTWGQKMDGYLCSNCRNTFINTWAYGPGCPYLPNQNKGCGNFEKVRGALYRWSKTEIGALVEDAIGTAKELRGIALERASEVVREVKKRVGDFLG